MSAPIRHHIRSNVVGYMALFVALSGTAYAVDGPLPGQNQVGSADIINNDVQTADIKDANLTTADIRSGAVTSGKVLDDTAEGGLAAADLAPGSVGSSELQTDAITDDDLAASAQFNGAAPTGGDLTGTYPNPTIGNGAVTADKIGSIPVARAFSPRDGSGGTCALNQVIPGDSTLTPLLFTFTSFDSTGTMHPADPDCNDPNRSRLTAPRDGIYQISAAVVWTGDVGGTRFLGLRRNGNNTNFVAASRVPSSVDTPEQSVSTLVKLNASENDYVEAVVSQNSGSPVSLDPNFARQHLAMHWVAPGG